MSPAYPLAKERCKGTLLQGVILIEMGLLPTLFTEGKESKCSEVSYLPSSPKEKNPNVARFLVDINHSKHGSIKLGRRHFDRCLSRKRSVLPEPNRQQLSRARQSQAKLSKAKQS